MLLHITNYDYNPPCVSQLNDLSLKYIIIIMHLTTTELINVFIAIMIKYLNSHTKYITKLTVNNNSSTVTIFFSL